MISLRPLIVACIILGLSVQCKTQDSKNKTDLKLWYNEPAANWNEALPIGNGFSGAMVFGGIDTEMLQLNENTLYSGEPSTVFKDISIGQDTLNHVIDLLKNQQFSEATKLVSKDWLGRLHQYYQPFGNLYISNMVKGNVINYYRDLDLSNAIVTTSYEQNGVKYKREFFASNPDQAIIIHLTSDTPKSIDVTLHFDSPHPTAKEVVINNNLSLHGQAPGYVERRSFKQMEDWGDQHKHPELYDSKGKRKFDHRVLYGDEIGGKGMRFESQIKPILPNNTGTVVVNDSMLHVFGTDDVYFVLTLATSYNGFDKSPSSEGVDESAKATRLLNQACAYNFETLKARHIKDYQSLFNRVSLHLTSNEQQISASTDQRIIDFAKHPDPSLSALLFQYGRYLMISGSRKGGQPLNLQGMWNKDLVPAWNSAYTMNINLEMNYWPAEITNLSECAEPLFTLIKELSISGTETAKNMYHRPGWVAHHNTSLWRESVPNDNVPSASFWPMSSGWLCSHLWEHYLFTNDKVFLGDTAYPMLKGASEFYASWLMDDGNGHLVTPAGVSPENTFISPSNKRATISMAPTMDMAIIRQCFTHTIAAAKILNKDDSFRVELQNKLDSLLPYRISSTGAIQEWSSEFKETDPQHRHLSHLYGFYPGYEITPDSSPQLFDAVRKTLEIRGDGATGWSMGWKINIGTEQIIGW